MMQKDVHARIAEEENSSSPYRTATDVVTVEVMLNSDLIRAYQSRWPDWKRRMEAILAAAASKL